MELTTLKQSLVRKKNRKLRRLRELYPDVRIKLFYGRDFRALMLKYGKLGLIGEMSGTLGQSTPAGRADSSLPAVAAELAAPDIDLAPGVDEPLPLVAELAALEDAAVATTADEPSSEPPVDAEATVEPGATTPHRRRRNRRRRGGDRTAGAGIIGRDRRAAGDR